MYVCVCASIYIYVYIYICIYNWLNEVTAQTCRVGVLVLLSQQAGFSWGSGFAVWSLGLLVLKGCLPLLQTKLGF